MAVEYKVLISEHMSEENLEKELNLLAEEGWRGVGSAKVRVQSNNYAGSGGAIILERAK